MYKSILVVSICLLFSGSAIAQSFTQVTGPITETASDSRSVNFLDINNDGWEDVYISNGPQGGAVDLLYLNDGAGQLVPVTNMEIVQATNPSDGASFADYNNDGHIDGVVSSWYGAEDLLYINDGSGNLIYNADAGLAGGSFAETAAFGDYDNDGWLDLYITNSGNSRTNYLYQNAGDGTFTRITSHPLVEDLKLSRGVIWGDFNNDRAMDVFITNEGTSSNDLYLGTGNGDYAPFSSGGIVSTRRSSMTASWGDIDNDRDMDVFIGNSAFFVTALNQLYINDGSGSFEEISGDPVVSANNCTFGSAFGDYDNDGDLDLIITNGFCNTSMQNVLYQNQGDGTFVDVSEELDVNGDLCSFGAAWGDINNDGYLDLGIANCKNGTAFPSPSNSFYLNQGSGNNWLKVQLEGTMSNKSAIGARIEARAVINGTPTWQIRDIQSQSGYAGQNSLVAHFGLGDASQVDSLIIHWPAGNRQILTDIQTNQQLAVTETININNQDYVSKEGPLAFDVYPNLITDTVAARIRIQNLESASPAAGRLMVYNMMGQVLHQKPLHIQEGITDEPLDIQSLQLAAGTYFVILELNDQRVSKQVIIR